MWLKVHEVNGSYFFTFSLPFRYAIRTSSVCGFRSSLAALFRNPCSLLGLATTFLVLIQVFFKVIFVTVFQV